MRTRLSTDGIALRSWFLRLPRPLAVVLVAIVSLMLVFKAVGSLADTLLRITPTQNFESESVVAGQSPALSASSAWSDAPPSHSTYTYRTPPSTYNPDEYVPRSNNAKGRAARDAAARARLEWERRKDAERRRDGAHR